MSWKQRKKCEAILDEENGYVKKVWGSNHTVCLAYPNVYRIAMANLGFQTVYKIFNDSPPFLCERVFLPAPGDDAEFAAGAGEIVSLENQKPLVEFDILAYSLSFENDYPNILTLLDRAGIPLLARERSDVHPLVIAGGIAMTINPEPLADFFDMFILGEAEETLPEFMRCFDAARRTGLDRQSLLLDLQKNIPGIYVPSLYSVHYHANGKIKDVTPVQQGLPDRIKIHPVKNIDSFCTEEVISAPHTEMEDMYLTEVNRGCSHRCRFCAASHVYRPLRFRSYEAIIASVNRGLMVKKKIGLVGTAVSDHPDLLRICQYIVDQGAQAGIGSLRLDRINEPIVDLLKKSGIETVALAPEAGSQKMRNLLRKDITEEDIISAVQLLIEKDISNLRLYFMIGLPGEVDEDIDAIIELAKKIQHAALAHTKGKRKFRRITLSVNQFIPKPQTPLQWCALADVQNVSKKIKKIVHAFGRDKQIHVIHDVPKWNYVQALLSLGDRRVGDILLAVHYSNGNWAKALKEVSINPDFYVYRQKDFDEVLPWDIIDLGLAKEKLVREYKKAVGED